MDEGLWLLGFEQVPDRAGAESLRGTRLVVPDGLPLEQPTVLDGELDAWYEEQLVGLAGRDPAGDVLGTVSGLDRLAPRTGSSSRSPTSRTVVRPVRLRTWSRRTWPRALVVDPRPRLLELDG